MFSAEQAQFINLTEKVLADHSDRIINAVLSVKDQIPKDGLLTPSKAANVIGISRTKLYNLGKKYPNIRQGNKYIFSKLMKHIKT